MNLLIDKLPETVVIDDTEVPISWDFRTSIKFADMMLSQGNYEQLELIEKVVSLYFNKEDIRGLSLDSALEVILWFYRCGKPKKDTGNDKLILSYAQDAGYISAAFLEQYNINIIKIKEMHWWEFRSLFDGLQDDVQISKIMGFRGMDLSKVSKEERSYYRKMQDTFKIENVQTETKEEVDYQRELTETLKTGGNIAAVKKKYNRE